MDSLFSYTIVQKSLGFLESLRTVADPLSLPLFHRTWPAGGIESKAEVSLMDPGLLKQVGLVFWNLSSLAADSSFLNISSIAFLPFVVLLLPPPF